MCNAKVFSFTQNYFDMKKNLLVILLAGAFQSAVAQVPSYVLDSTSFNALTYDGGQTEIQFADINQDSNVDLLTVGDHGSPNINTNQHGISVFFGNGTGTGWTLFQSGNFGYGGIAVGDVNNDNFLDVAYGIHHDYSATDFGDQLLEAALGDGTGMNWTPWDDSLATAGETYGMFGTDLGDANNDGLLDIVSGSFGCCAGTHVYLNLGTGVWQHSFGYINGNTGHYVQFGDLNHDGNLDFVCCHQSGAAYFGDGTGNFIPKHLNLPGPGNLGFNDISLADVDNDGDDDFAFIHNSIPYVYKWNNATQQWISNSAGLNTGGTFSCIKLADVNSDGLTDAVAAVTGNIKIYLGNGGNSWNNVLTIPSYNMTSCEDISIADVDGNGFPEIAFLADYTTGLFSHINKLKILKNTASVSALNIQQNFPKGYECFPSNAVRFITWSSSVPTGNNSSVKIEFSSTGALGPWSVVTNAAPNNGTYQWAVPPSVLSYDCYLRLIVADSTTLLTDTSQNVNPFQVGVCNPALAVSGLQTENDFIIYPNPVKNELTVFSSQLAIGDEIKIFDVVGKEVFKKIIERLNSPDASELRLQTSSLTSGIYFLKVGNRTKKVVKN